MSYGSCWSHIFYLQDLDNNTNTIIWWRRDDYVPIKSLANSFFIFNTYEWMNSEKIDLKSHWAANYKRRHSISTRDEWATIIKSVTIRLFLDKWFLSTLWWNAYVQRGYDWIDFMVRQEKSSVRMENIRAGIAFFRYFVFSSI